MVAEIPDCKSRAANKRDEPRCLPRPGADVIRNLSLPAVDRKVITLALGSVGAEILPRAGDV